MSQQQSFRSAVKWAYAMNWGEQAFSALFTFFLAALLGPSEFGTVAMALIYISFLQMFLNQGFAAALIQRKDLRSEHLDSVFWLNLAAGLVLMGLSVAFSGWWARVNHLPDLAPILCVLSIAIPIESLTIVQRAILQREMDFRSLSVRSNVAVLAGGLVGITLAYRGFGAWALVAQLLVKDVVALGLLWKLSHWRPRMRFCVSSMKELLGFSSATFTGQLGYFANTQSDALLMGLFFGPVPVGLYRLADRLITIITQVAISSLQVVSFPNFSRLQHDRSELRKAVLSCIRMSATLMIPALAGLAVTSDLVMAAIGPQWALAADALKILCIVGIVRTLSYFVGPMLQAIGKPNLLAGVEWTHAVVGVGALVVAANLLQNYSTWGQVVGIAGTRFATGVLFLTPLVLYLLKRYCRITLGALATTMLPSVVAASSVVAVVIGLNATGVLNSARPILSLLVAVPLGALVGVSVLWILDSQLRSIVRDVIPGRKEVSPKGLPSS
jgi:PST family polysaccharide transporter